MAVAVSQAPVPTSLTAAMRTECVVLPARPVTFVLVAALTPSPNVLQLLPSVDVSRVACGAISALPWVACSLAEGFCGSSGSRVTVPNPGRDERAGRVSRADWRLPWRDFDTAVACLLNRHSHCW